MYQGRSLSTSDPAAPVRVVLVVEVPAHCADEVDAVTGALDEVGRFVGFRFPQVSVRPTAVANPRVRAAPIGPADPPAGTGLLIDALSRRVVVDGDRVALTYKEFELLRYLVHRAGSVIGRDELLDGIWSADEASPRTVDTHVRRVRVKLGRYCDTLTTVRGRGYRFDPGPSTRYRHAPTSRTA